jgi:phenylacetic acid degradation operon negative regulatory protein
MIERGDRRIFSAMEPAKLEDGWVLVAFSIPEAERDRRYQLRKRLKWLGFGDLVNGLYIAPRRGVDELAATLADVGLAAYVDVFEGHYFGFDEVKDVVARAWDLDALRALYLEFLEECAPIVRRWARASKADDRQAFIDYTLTVHRWRKFPYLDPGLPVELLPARWQGNKSAQTFAKLRRRLEVPAHRYVRSVVITGP